MLAGVIGRFTEGIATADLACARSLLNELMPEDNEELRKYG